MTDYETPRFKSSDVARAAGMAPATFRSYFKRGQFRVIGDMRKAEAFGLPNLFSLRDALGFAVAAALIRAGADAQRAWEAAMLKFAHTGSDERLPARLFDVHQHGQTILTYFPGSGTARIRKSGDISGVGELFAGPNVDQEAAIVLILNFLEQRVLSDLGATNQG